MIGIGQAPDNIDDDTEKALTSNLLCEFVEAERRDNAIKQHGRLTTPYHSTVHGDTGFTRTDSQRYAGSFPTGSKMLTDVAKTHMSRDRLRRFC